jgi:sporulation protein YlmC with PRC-barrel domain
MVEISRLFWRRVITSDGFVLGELESGDLDTNTWQMKSFFVSLTDEATEILGFERPFLGKVTVCLPVSTVHAIKDTVILNKTMQELKELKECKK